MGLVDHLRIHFGEDGGDAAAWSFDDAGFGIVTYDDQPVRGAITYLTMGLSRHVLEQRSGKSICQELLMSVRADQKEISPERSLASLAHDFLERHSPIPDGQVIGWQGGVFPGSRFTAVFCTSARYFPESFAHVDCDPPIVFVWLIPITESEATYCRSHGASAFEDLLVAQDPDLLDLDRPELTIPCSD
ncbi:MAG TPA: suppressor of fused domain protein [Polyangiaceae bacterium]|nr:suppressor of fused domain protein [Polyangiaceae bacterium]